jgi:hypothetical protein
VIAIGGLVLILYSSLGGGQDSNSQLPTYGLFAMLGGLLIAMAADAGQKMNQKQKDRAAKKQEKAK